MKPLRYLLGAFAALLVTAAGVAAQTPAPSASPSPAPSRTSGDTARPFSMAMRMALARRGSWMRADMTATLSPALPVPPLAMTFVFDRATNTLTLWSDRTRKYWQTVVRPGTPAPPAARPQLGLLDLFELTLRLTGHATVIGMPATGFSFDAQTRTKGQSAAFRLAGTTQLCDDFLFPLTLDATIDPGVVPTRATIAFAVDDFARAVPATVRFEIPTGYAKTSSPLEAIMQQPPQPRR